MNKILRKAVFTFAALALASCNVQAAGEELNYTVFNDGEISGADNKTNLNVPTAL